MRTQYAIDRPTRCETTGEAAIEAIALEKSYGDVRVLDGVDLRVARGSVFALLGPNGAGKTTTVRILSTLTRPDGGRARVAGFDIVDDRRRVRRAISLTGQYAAVDDLQTGEENLRMMGRLCGLSGAEARDRAASFSRASTSRRPAGAGSRRTPAACAAASTSPRASSGDPR
jgi:ABC-2 type transport system ATP-binding protein